MVETILTGFATSQALAGHRLRALLLGGFGLSALIYDLWHQFDRPLWLITSMAAMAAIVYGLHRWPMPWALRAGALTAGLWVAIVAEGGPVAFGQKAATSFKTGWDSGGPSAR